MRKIILQVFIVFILLSLVSCGNESEIVYFYNAEYEPNIVEIEMFEECSEELDLYDADDDVLSATFPQEPHAQTERPLTLERNGIDQFFDEMAWTLSLPCTASMSHFAQIISEAWRAESDNFFEQLLSQTQNELVREWLKNERYFHSRYNWYRAQFTANFEASNMFDGDDAHLFTGSIVRILFPSEIGEGHREKALELYARLERIGVNPQFIFCEEYYSRILKEVFPQLWEVAFE